ncbi:MAG: hypothetical protein A3E87_00245 [Gammaproteobacteria bacterium RIFCSPHIGHO2_12_FULL_35_23]|nr:MAG: hypothetical protein A3E87_00245 [Gammaproteobacteria bacterium RIFCSPHIGHO2_12_FULL_35_23]
MFLADDPKNQLLKSYKQIPFFTISQVLNLLEKDIDRKIEPDEWLALKTSKENMFAIHMPDESMEPIIPVKSTIFILHQENLQPCNNDIILIYLKQYNALIVRKFIIKVNVMYLSPENSKLYKESELTEDMKIVGLVTDCHYSLRKQYE